MAIPDYQSLMLPVLRAASHGEVRMGTIVEQIADELQLSQQERSELLPSGTQTTSSFTSAARDTAKSLSKRIVLIDGQELAKLLVRFNLGCRVEETLHLKKIDEEVFS